MAGAFPKGFTQEMPDAEYPLSACVTGAAALAGFGSGNPVTDEDYTDGKTKSWRGSASVVLRAGYGAGDILLTVSAEGLQEASVSLRCIPE